MSFFVRALSYVLGVCWWLYLRFPRFDTERRSTVRYRNALRLTREVWIGSCCTVLLILEAFPHGGLGLSLVLMLLTAFVSYVILDETQ